MANKLADLFITDKPLQIKEQDSQIIVPENYDPYKKLKSLLKEGAPIHEIQLQRKNAKRNEAYKDYEEENVETILKSIAKKQFVPASTTQPVEQDQIKVLFPCHHDKQKRYETYCREKKEQLPKDEKIDDEERKDFERLYQMFQIGSKNVQQQPVQQQQLLYSVEQKQQPEEDHKNYLFSKRSTKRWAPENMFCRRMGIPNPYSEEEVVMIQKMNHRVVNAPKLIPPGAAISAKFKSGGVYNESEEVPQNVEQDIQFDPAALGLPLSFKSMSMERNNRERQLQIINEEKMLKIRQRKEMAKNKGENEGEEQDDPEQKQNDEAPRLKNMSLFESIFGDE